MERHTFDLISFLFGAFFVGAGLSAVFFGDPFDHFDGRWVWPAILIVAGLGVLATTMRTRHGADAATLDEATPQDTPPN